MDTWLMWLVERLIRERISFSLTPMSDGQWNVGVDTGSDSKRIAALIREYKQQHEMPV